MKNTYNVILLATISVICVLLFSPPLVLADEGKYDEEIPTELDRDGETEVLVKIVDDSRIDISSNLSSEERDALFNQRATYLQNKVAILIDSIEPSIEVKRVLFSGRGFTATVNLESFQALVDHPAVDYIYANRLIPLHGVSNDDAYWEERFDERLEQSTTIENTTSVTEENDASINEQFTEPQTVIVEPEQNAFKRFLNFIKSLFKKDEKT